MTLHAIHTLPRGEIHHARAEQVYPLLEPGSVSLVISDGPYGMRKAEWDKMGVDGLADWYAPHVEAWGRVCAPSATVYLWNTAEGWARIDPVMRAAGWVFRSLVVWDKVRVGLTLPRCAWPSPMEVAGHYTRGDVALTHPEHSSRRLPGEHVRATRNVWEMAEAAYRDERLMAPGLVRNMDGTETREALHPCQKPLAFYRRIIRASSRPGELVLEPFGGTCRTAAAVEEMLPDEVRRYVCVEPDEDGRDYLPAVLRDIRHRIEASALTRRCGPVDVEPITRAEQAPLFGAAK